MTPIPSPDVTMTEALPTWRDGAAKAAITDFAARLCREASRNFVAPAAVSRCSNHEGRLSGGKSEGIQFNRSKQR